MYKQSDKQKFVSTLITNVGYFNKDLTLKQVNEFMKANNNFVPRQAIRKNGQGEIFSFIQLTGFVKIGKNLIQMYIGIPKSYPHQAPAILLAIDRNHFTVHDEQKLLQFNMIACQRNQMGEDFVRLRFAMLQKQWNPKNPNCQSLNALYNSLIQLLNRPPIIKPIIEQSNYNYPNNNINMMNNNNNINYQANQYRNQQNGPKIPKMTKTQTKINSKQINQMINAMYADSTQLVINKQSLQDANQQLDYQVSRQIFLKQHLPKLKTKLAQTRFIIQNESQILRNDIKDIDANRKCDKLLEINENQMNKLNILTEQQALKQAQVKLRAKMESDAKNKFSEYKKIMKILYEKMFDNQTKLLKSAK